ncbi:MAG: transporter related protein [Bacillota bacterium]|jgi:ribose transport system ATP-binding protein|nr:transporter related protein [Bacillota bacterium]
MILEVKGIRKCFGGVVALSDGNLVCRRGRITGLLGANGSGKSTISKIITGVYSADCGEINYNGQCVKYKNPNEARQDGIAMVFQNLSLVPDLTVWQNIVLGAEQKKGLGLDNQCAKEQSEAIINKLQPGLDISKKVSQLNPGEMQIVEIAKAISANPRLLILDEPTAALEQAQVKNLFAYMRELADQGVSMIFTSHRMWEVMEICDDVIIFRNGENVAGIDFHKEGKDAERIIGYITGDTKKEECQIGDRQIDGETVLSIKGMNYGKMLKNISFDLRAGEVLGIGGLAGQGQNELLLALAGAYPEMKCDAEIKGRKIKLTKPVNAVRNSILLVPGDRQLEGLFLKDSVYKNTIFPKLALKRQPIFTPDKKYRQECEQMVKSLSVKTHNIDTPVGTLSGGNQQKVVVGKWLSFDINVLLLADPAKGVDIGAKRDLYQYITDMVREKNTSVILYASDSEELIQYCDRVLIMYEGQIVESLEGCDINEDAIVSASMCINKAKEVG